MKSILSISNLKFNYKHSTDSINIPTFNLNEKERVVLYGDSGCGKTTFLELISGILTPKEGKIEFLNKTINILSSSERDYIRGMYIGYIFQNFYLIPYLTIKENIMLPFHIYPQLKKKIINVEEHILNLSKKLDIHLILQRKPFEISQGQAQRSIIIRSIIKKPMLLMADEPTSALDKKNTKSFISLVNSLCQEEGIPFLCTSHNEEIGILFNKQYNFKDLQK